MVCIWGELSTPEIDNADEALSDSFANELAIYNQSSTGDEPHSNTCFFVAEDCVVRCRAAIEHNDVGLRIWEAGLLLTGMCMYVAFGVYLGLGNSLDLLRTNLPAELVSHYRKQFAHKRVLELGAGLGLTSLCAAVVEPAHIFISDYSLPTLANIRYNIELNALHPGARAEDLQLNWCTMTQDTAQDLDPDIILAADTVYDRQFIPAFCDTLKHFASAMPEAKRQTCTPPSTSTTARSAGIDWTVKPVILIAATLRNPDTFAAFMRALSERGVVAVNLSDVLKAEVPQQLHYGFRDLIQVLQVFAAPSES